MTTTRAFGYYPATLEIDTQSIVVRPLPDLAKIVAAMRDSEGIENDWIYASPARHHDMMSGEERNLPYASRIFGLPQTHELMHPYPDGDTYLDFHLWMLSFFTGMRLTGTEAGFLDATPVKPGKLVDFVILGDLAKAVDLAEKFWVTNRTDLVRSRLVSAAVHALFMAQNPRHLQFERFIYLYTALDACYALAAKLSPTAGRLPHAERIAWLCKQFQIPTPTWAFPDASGDVEVADLRNETLHEALFMKQPLGFRPARSCRQKESAA